MVRVALLTVILGLAAPVAASGSTVTFRHAGEGSEEPFPLRFSPVSLYELRVDGEAGEANVFKLDATSGFFRVVDGGAVLRAGAGCEQVDAHSARCAFTADHPARVTGFVKAADGNDHISLGGLVASVTAGGAGDDRIEGGDGGDVIDGGPGADSLSGGSGYLSSDTVTYESHTAPVRVSLNGEADDGADGEGDNIADDFESIAGGAGPDLLEGLPSRFDRLVGNGGADVLRGLAGSDTLEGGHGDDRIEGGEGDDSLDGGLGADTFLAGPGDRDTVTYFWAPEGIVVDLDGVADDGAPGEGDNVTEDAEFLTGSKHDDVLIGGHQPNFIEGVDGRDSIYGLGGNDNLSGGRGGGVIVPGSGQDHVSTRVGYDVFDAFTAVDSRDGERDTINCSGPFDVKVDAVDDKSLCRPEAVIEAVEPLVRVDRHTGRGRLHARLWAYHREASGRFVIRLGFHSKRVLGRGRFRLRFGTPRYLPFKLSDTGLRRFRRRLREADGLRVRARFTGRDGSGDPVFGTGYYKLVRRYR